MNAYYVVGIPFSDELYHHGIKGQRWGIRRFENPDGTLTEEGKKRYAKMYQRGSRLNSQNKKLGKIRFGAIGKAAIGGMAIGSIHSATTSLGVAAAGPILAAPIAAITIGSLVKDYRDAQALKHYKKVVDDMFK